MTTSSKLRTLVRFLFRWRGIRAIAHILRKRLLRHESIWIDDFDGDLRFYCQLDGHIGSYIYWRGYYSGNQLKVLDGLLQNGMTFVDVGANQGEFTLFAAKRLPSGRVISFEPDPEMHVRLLANIHANGFTNITVEEVGLWSQEGIRLFYRPDRHFSDGSEHEGLGSLFPRTRQTASALTIQLTTLDERVKALGLQCVDVMKLDVEGAELRVLQGAEGTIRDHRPIILLEVDRGCAAAAGTSTEELLEYLSRWYEFELITSKGGTRRLNRNRMGEHQDVVCRPL